MQIFITGFTGFIGNNLLQYIAGNYPYYQVDGFSRNPDLEVYPGLRKVFTSFDTDFDNYDAVIHMAGKAHDLKRVTDEKEYYDVNYELTKQVFDRFITSKASRFIFLSSVKAVADKVNGVLTEEEEPGPQTPYGKSKLMAERYLLSRELPAGKKLYILRPAMVHGPGCKGNLNLLFALISKGIPYPLGAFDNRRSYLSIDNFCFITDRLIHGSIATGVYNIADTDPVSTVEIVTEINKTLGKRNKVYKPNAKMIRFLVKVFDRLKLPLDQEKLDKLTDSYIVSNKKIRAAMGEELPLTAKEGLLITIKYLTKAKNK